MGKGPKPRRRDRVKVQRIQPYARRRRDRELSGARRKQRFMQLVTELSRAFALCATSDEATEIRDDVSYFQAIQSALNKKSGTNSRTPDLQEEAVKTVLKQAELLCVGWV